MNIAQSWDTACWHLVHTRPRQEARAKDNLRTLNIETYMPMQKAKQHNRFTGEATSISKPLFPRYIFARFKINDLYHKVCFTRGVQGLVCFNQCPTTVDEEIIALIQSKESTDGLIRIGEEITPGEQVIIKDGPFKNITAIFERTISDADRVLLLLETVSYQARVVVDRDSIGKSSHDDRLNYQ